jgi:molybdopterin-guanine dinucleotide biosynthesis protein A
MPLVRADLVRSLLERLVSTDPADAAVPGVAAVPGAAAVHAEAAVLVENGEARPLPMALRRAPARQATEQAISAGERSLRHLLARLRAEAIDEAEWRRLDPDADSLVDIDTAADLDRARRRFAR